MEEANEDDKEEESNKKHEHFDLLNLGVSKENNKKPENKKKEEVDEVNFL